MNSAYIFNLYIKGTFSGSLGYGGRSKANASGFSREEGGLNRYYI
jgi:hypothetical protein